MADATDITSPHPSPLIKHPPSPPPSPPTVYHYNRTRSQPPPPPARQSRRGRKRSRRSEDAALSEDLTQAQRASRRAQDSPRQTTSRKRVLVVAGGSSKLGSGGGKNSAKRKHAPSKKHRTWNKLSEEEAAELERMNWQADQYFTAFEKLPTSAPPAQLLTYSGRLQQYEQTVADGAIDDTTEPDEATEELREFLQQDIPDDGKEDFMERTIQKLIYSDSLGSSWDEWHPNEICSFSLENHIKTTWLKGPPQRQRRQRPKHPLVIERNNFYEVARRIEDKRRAEEDCRKKERAYARVIEQQKQKPLDPLIRVREDFRDEGY